MSVYLSFKCFLNTHTHASSKNRYQREKLLCCPYLIHLPSIYIQLLIPAKLSLAQTGTVSVLKKIIFLLQILFEDYARSLFLLTWKDLEQ